MSLATERQIRKTVFDWLGHQVDLHGDVLPREILAMGIDVDGHRMPLIGPSGIFKPRLLDYPLSITTAPAGPYDDEFSVDETVLHYRYRGIDPKHRDNVGLRLAMELELPLCYFFGAVPGRYLAVWPVFVKADNPAALTFDVVVDDASRIGLDQPLQTAEAADGRRSYLTAVVQRRMHQRGFRERVLRAYREHCAICNLAHRELLDSAHIIPDFEPDGVAIVPNGLALCRLHHAAFDRQFIGIRPDGVIDVRSDILLERDGPMLRHGLQDLQGARIIRPRDPELHPDPARLEWRYEQFRRSA